MKGDNEGDNEGNNEGDNIIQGKMKVIIKMYGR